MFSMTEGAPQSSSSVVNVTCGAVSLSLATNAAAATAVLTSGEDGGVSQVVAQPLSKVPQALSRGDGDGVFSPGLVRSCSYWPSQPCATLTSVHGNPSY